MHNISCARTTYITTLLTNVCQNHGLEIARGLKYTNKTQTRSNTNINRIMAAETQMNAFWSHTYGLDPTRLSELNLHHTAVLSTQTKFSITQLI